MGKKILAGTLILLVILSIPTMVFLSKRGYDDRIDSGIILLEDKKGKSCYFPSDWNRYIEYPIELFSTRKSKSSIYEIKLNPATQLCVEDESGKDYKTESQTGTVFLLVQKDNEERAKCYRYAFVENPGELVAITEDIQSIVFMKKTKDGTSVNKAKLFRNLKVEDRKLILEKTVPETVTEQEKGSLYWLKPVG